VIFVNAVLIHKVGLLEAPFEVIISHVVPSMVKSSILNVPLEAAAVEFTKSALCVP